jgi:exodeoxyribonuclease VIII
MSKWKPKNGFNKNIPNEVYHANRSHVSSSVLKQALKDIEEFKRIYIDGEKAPVFNLEAMDFGSYIHTLILEPHLVEKEFAIWDKVMREGEEWDEFVISNKGKIIITRSQHAHAKELLENFYRKEILFNGKTILLNELFTGGEAEETCCTNLDGIDVKVRFDYRDGKRFFINDIKTTSSAIRSRKDVEKVCASFVYDLSAALYCDVVEQVTGDKHDFYFTFISKKDGQSTIWKASDEMLERGRKKYREAIKRILHGRKTGQWVAGIEELR